MIYCTLRLCNFVADELGGIRSGSWNKGYFCGGETHGRRNCPAKDAVFGFCKKISHFANVCLSKMKSSSNNRNHTSAALNTHSEPNLAVLCSLPYCLQVRLEELPTARLGLRGHSCQWHLIDTGSTESHINAGLAYTLEVDLSIKSSLALIFRSWLFFMHAI